ncbi:MAG: DoxX family protein [Gemmataceae bacterium]
MTRPAAFFLILLRLAIGWHFLVEGFQKIPSEQLAALGLFTNNKNFSSAGYFREAPGPLGSVVRQVAGDADSDALARMTLQPVPGGRDLASYPPQLRVPAGLKADWEAYLQAFTRHYDLDEKQQKAGQAALEQTAARVVALLTYVPDADPEKRDKDPHYADYTTEQTRNYPSGEVKRRMTLGERIAEYQKKLDELRDVNDRKMWVFGKDVEGARLRAAKGELTAWRAGILADLDKETQAFKDVLDKQLTSAQKEVGPLPTGPARDVKGLLAQRDLIGLIDLATPWMLAGAGASLLLGLFTRLGAFVAMMFLLMTYLAVPAFPWLPAPPAAEGSYLFVNKNVIEMLALAALMFLPTGRWFGADAILSAFYRLLFGRRPAANANPI